MKYPTSIQADLPAHTEHSSLAHCDETVVQAFPSTMPCCPLTQAVHSIPETLSTALSQLPREACVKWRFFFETSKHEVFAVDSQSPSPQYIPKVSSLASKAADDLVSLTGIIPLSGHDEPKNAAEPMTDLKLRKRRLSQAEYAEHSKKQRPTIAVQDTSITSQATQPRASFSSTLPGPGDTQKQSKSYTELDGECRGGNSNNSDVDDDEDFAGYVIQRVRLPVDSLGDAYEKMFKMIQQKGCKKILQTWIKKAHPKKQANYPYNGGSRASEREDYDVKNKGVHTAPPYWLRQDDWDSANPKGSRHREPDHITKRERLNMCVHLLRLEQKGDDFEFSLEILQESTKGLTDLHPSHFNANGHELLSTLYAARDAERRYEAKEMDRNTMVEVLIPVRDRTKLNMNSKPSPNFQTPTSYLEQRVVIGDMESDFDLTSGKSSFTSALGSSTMESDRRSMEIRVGTPNVFYPDLTNIQESQLDQQPFDETHHTRPDPLFCANKSLNSDAASLRDNESTTLNRMQIEHSAKKDPPVSQIDLLNSCRQASAFSHPLSGVPMGNQQVAGFSAPLHFNLSNPMMLGGWSQNVGAPEADRIMIEERSTSFDGDAYQMPGFQSHGSTASFPMFDNLSSCYQPVMQPAPLSCAMATEMPAMAPKLPLSNGQLTEHMFQSLLLPASSGDLLSSACNPGDTMDHYFTS